MNFSQESTVAATKMSRRRGPLHTCGASISAIASKAYTKTRDSRGPIRSMSNRMAKLASFSFPLIHAIQFQWLALLSFADDNILIFEKLMEKLFPPSTRLFDKIDEFLGIAETLPRKFDEAVSKFPTSVHQVPFLDLASTFLISWLKLFISKLTRWGSNNAKEREIRVDINCNNLNIEGESAEQAYLNIESPSHISISASSLNEPEIVRQEHSSPDSPMDTRGENVERLSFVSDCSENGTRIFTKSFKSVVMECSYKEMLEKGEKRNGENEEAVKADSPKAIASKKEVVESKSIEMELPILELFEASWHMKPGKVGK